MPFVAAPPGVSAPTFPVSLGRLRLLGLSRLGLLALGAALAGCGDDSGSGGSGGSGAGGSGAGPAEVQGCEGTTLLESDADTSLPGPWPVGAKTLNIGGLVVEAWYPAKLGSDMGASAVEYDIRDFLPAAEAEKISEADRPRQVCNCFADLPVDDAHGPYPVIVFVHGTAGFRSQSLELTSHWASRGFVVLAADHPGLYLKDLLGGLCGAGPVERDLDGDLAALVAAVKSGVGLGDLGAIVDGTRIGMSGHSAGGGAIEQQGEVAQVLIPMAAGGVTAGAALKSTLVFGAKEDQVVEFSAQQEGYAASPAPKRLAGLSPAGHLAFASLCEIVNDAGEDLVAIGKANQVCGLEFGDALFDCDPSYVEAQRGWTIVNDLTSATYEETLHCQPSRADRLTGAQDRYPELAEYQEEL